MPSPFLDPELAKGILRYWGCRPVEVEWEGLRSVVGLRSSSTAGLTLYRKLLTVYTGYLMAPDDAPLATVLEFVDELARRERVIDIALKIGYKSETALSAEFSARHLAGRQTLGHGFYAEVVDHEGVVNLTEPFGSYLSSLPSGYREYFQRGERRQLYHVECRDGYALTRAEFDDFTTRMRAMFEEHGDTFAWGPGQLDYIFDCCSRGHALLFLVRARSDPRIFCDLLVLYDNVDAYYYGVARRSGPGVFNGVGHYAQIACIRYLGQRGLRAYSLGPVDDRGDTSLRSVRAFKRSLSPARVPMIQLRRQTSGARLFFMARKVQRRLRRLTAA